MTVNGGELESTHIANADFSHSFSRLDPIQSKNEGRKIGIVGKIRAMGALWVDIKEMESQF